MTTSETNDPQPALTENERLLAENKRLRGCLHAEKLENQRVRLAAGRQEHEIEILCAPRLGYEKFQLGEPGYSPDFVTYNIGDHVAESLVAALGNALDVARACLAGGDLLNWLSAPDRTAEIEATVARILVPWRTAGLCRYGEVCEVCDCFATVDGGAKRDAEALTSARVVLKALADLRAASIRPCPECGVVLEFHWPDCSLNAAHA